MASKIHIGDMPELMENILNNLNNEICSLYSCALVSRHCGATLHKLVLEFSQSLELKPEVFYTLGENKQFFSRIQHLYLDIIYDNNIESATTLLRTLAESTTKINTIELKYFDSNYEPQIFHALIHIIKSQEQLRLFRLAGDYSVEFHGVISALESQKNSLQKVRLDNCYFSAEFEVFNNCKNLETLHMRYCSTKPLKSLDYKVSTLEVIRSKIDSQSMALIFEKSGIFLQRLKLVLDEEFQDVLLLLDALKSFCPNITYLSIQDIGFSPQLVELIGNLQKLQFFSLWCYDVYDMPEEVLKIRVIKFSEILPLTLQYLNLRGTWLEPYTDILFNHCNAPLKKMLIYRLNNERISKALVEFCMRNKTLNYVGVYKYLDIEDNTRKKVEPYVELVPYKYIVVD
ncbi:RNI-like protein [Gigaspora margarita]|uniref:RNI-like protein n=1 Tax=Gigaspora margarita TaxID=4874 RepID=A0A8H4ERR6_GIGMA|nr:RNI-like protein [Gigaspora margarita]